MPLWPQDGRLRIKPSTVIVKHNAVNGDFTHYRYKASSESFFTDVLLFTTTITFTPAYLGPDFQNFLRRSQENLRKMTKVTKMLRKSYDDADFQNFLRKA